MSVTPYQFEPQGIHDFRHLHFAKIISEVKFLRTNNFSTFTTLKSGNYRLFT